MKYTFLQQVDCDVRENSDLYAASNAFHLVHELMKVFDRAYSPGS